MWKFFSRRAVERTQQCVVRNWSNPCNESDTSTAQTPDNDKDNFFIIKSDNNNFGPEIFLTRKCFSGSNKTDYKYSSSKEKINGKNKKKIADEDASEQCKNDLLGAITWSGAIICGWYASQICFLRRRQQDWDAKSKHQTCKYLCNPVRAMHTNLAPQYVFASPPLPKATNNVYPSIVETIKKESLTILDNQHKFEYFERNNSESDQNFVLHNVNNPIRSDSISSNDSNSSKQSVSEAVTDLVNFIGECEYKMALRYLEIHNYVDAIVHLKLSLSHNHPNGSYNLGLCYEQGLGVRKNMHRAMECYQKASSLGHAKAMYNLGVFYAHGLGGLEKDLRTAKKCLLTAAKLGQPEARSFLNTLANSDAEISDFLNKEPSSTVVNHKNYSDKLSFSD